MTPLLDGDRLWQSLEAVSSFGGTPDGGLHRLAASSADGFARDFIASQARELGCRIRVDALGNLFMGLAGTDPAAQAILVGSHLDSQPYAGRYDGTYGVMAGLEALRVLYDDRPSHSVELVCWTGEEGARFRPAMLGSSGFAGITAKSELLSHRDSSGLSLGDALAVIGYAGTDEVFPHEFCAYLEAHIEQGPILERLGRPIGVVHSVQAQHWWHVTVRGRCDHSGTRPMEDRADALVASADIITAVRSIGLRWPGIGRATVGHLTVHPNSPNVVPGQVELTVEFRHPEQDAADAMASHLTAVLDEVAGRHQVHVSATQVLASPPVTFDKRVASVIARAADNLGIDALPMVSGAAHDACPVSTVIPTAMLFIPCRDGISHAPEESITPRWAHDGAQVLLSAIRELDVDAARGSR